MTQLQHASIDWKNDRPLSTRFREAYFDPDVGPTEARHVFLAGNRLAERFANLEQPHFCIAETGFGSGLNFLVTRELWRQRAPAHARLHYISVEKHPLNADDLARCLALWPGFSDATAQLLAQYPPLLEGLHRLELDNGCISLTLVFGDAARGLAEVEGTVDAWYLDGFEPAGNPDIKSAALFAQVARLSHACGQQPTTLACACSAPRVQVGLQQAGFRLTRTPGPGSLPEILSATFAGAPAKGQTGVAKQPWFDRPAPLPRPDAALVLGAGLAGACAAHALARRGIAVTVLERCAKPASGGSGNRQGALYAKLPVRPTKQGLLHSTGLDYSRHLLAHLSAQGLLPDHAWQACGLLQLAQNDKEIARQRQLVDTGAYPDTLVRAVSAGEASDIAGTDTPHSGLFFPGAGWVSPVELCQALLQHPLISLRTGTTITSLEPQPDGQWQVRCDSGTTYQAPVVIVATAAAARALPALSHLPLKSIRGQVSETPQPATQAPLRTVVCGDGYIPPPMNGTYCFGATFDLHDSDTEVRPEDHLSNLATLTRSLPTLGAALSQQPLQGRVAFRCSTPDYLPIVGPAPNAERFVSDYARLRQDRKWSFDTEPSHHGGLYVSVGHGSKGLLTCPVGAELLASLVCNEPLPLGRTLTDALSPARFIIKNLIRGSI
ncbi:bifunctional tRNA (5-methylaminomethyl-2-thiouridine)(34)-methyltransferase MnmD/FAD-dependent 5-carboxymethylaminomethyl-2-thiouridine(34) oxidoreductase MnmC [Marinobacterium rhizophilum]|uniref:tRNA 5-methylaminomethyl-2-thiouridine biosynthesis bifunctional protein MnmC n=1 Tax=Marinobacterium rhizophilum TaxID=420402 RepID=A0ABY5HCC6_9GAMM|nr:bifunctional tRNA (5-methylaminomethyl-2-thiouridine)(34)-methyltransferase MnmD/FAD-dependent 5-carboxymethylaminomethyl-2-thiouridine(34) oxidoreductase MnmC [Marinobacterium rhizophilum]UTW10002.1 bifunctional tRNA (5-methylaminomethyl-2-thiouridine)(34)-methyltransferase MnmD/FAD-dependent 5-carboxymethylaminomethyl-2-thiouridine(34) oxidoreductase MnmC [Marinobacterium rhizophilum]